MSKRSTRKSASGFTLVELLVASALSLAVAGAAMTLALSGRQIYEADSARTGVNQNLRVSKDFIVTDIRQAGERLGNDFPAIEIIDGTAGAPDELVIRRNLSDTVLRICRDLSGTARFVHVAEKINPPPPGCIPWVDNDADGWPDNVQVWRARRLAEGGLMRGYVYDPVSGNGEFFTILREGNGLRRLGLVATVGHSWQYVYPLVNQPRVYILEERRYQLTNDLLKVIVNQETANAVHLVDGIRDLQALAVFRDGTQQASLGFVDDWHDLRGIDITLEADAPLDRLLIERRWSSEIVPRNVLSR